jgi:hypothetical protein
MIIAAGTPSGAYQVDVLRSSLECEGPRVARAAFSRWFDAPLERCMAALADRALAYARAQQVDVAGLLAEGKDWDLGDSTTATVRDALREAFPSTGEDAALNVHTVRSVGGVAPVRDHCSPAREHDSRHLQIDESWQGSGQVDEQAAASSTRLRACNVYNGRFVIRLKDHGKPKVDHMARGQVTQAFFPGSDLDALLDGHILVLDGRAVEADVRVGNSTPPLHLSLVGVHTPKGDGFFLPNLPPKVGPRQAADLYRVR